MKLTSRSSITLLIGLLLVPSVLLAQVTRSRWEKVDDLQPGSRITVTLKTGQNLEGDFRRSLTDVLVLTTDLGEILAAKSDIRTVVLVTKDRLRNGTLTGTSVGFAAGFLTLAAFNAKATASGPIWDGEAVGYYTATGLIGAGIGALVGSAIDHARKTSQVIYVSAQP